MLTVCTYYEVFNDETGKYLREEMCLSQLSYKKDGQDITLKHVRIENISQDTIEISTNEGDLPLIPVEDIINWEIENAK